MVTAARSAVFIQCRHILEDTIIEETVYIALLHQLMQRNINIPLRKTVGFHLVANISVGHFLRILCREFLDDGVLTGGNLASCEAGNLLLTFLSLSLRLRVDELAII
jgi:hypothetical protein